MRRDLAQAALERAIRALPRFDPRRGDISLLARRQVVERTWFWPGARDGGGVG